MKALSWFVASATLAAIPYSLLLADDKPAAIQITAKPAASPEQARFLRRQAAFYTDYLYRTNLCRVGEEAPMFNCRTMTGDEFSFRKQRQAKAVVLVTFIQAGEKKDAADARRLEKELRAKYGERNDFKFLTIVSSDEPTSLETFATQQGISPSLLVADPESKMFYEFATDLTHRSYVIGKDGKVKLAVGGTVELRPDGRWKMDDGQQGAAVTGYSEATFQEIARTLARELGAVESDR